MTFSISGFCKKTGMVGVAITTSSIAVASRCPWVRSGVGAATTQNITDPSLGNLMLDYLEQGLDTQQSINEVTKDRKFIEYRQLALIDNKGNSASFTGSKTLLDFCLHNNYYISLSGIVTFKNATSLRDIIKYASMDYLLIETDSPFLASVPMRGRENEPSFIKYTANYLAEFYSMNIDDFIKLTDNNFYKLFSRVKEDN